MNLDGPRGLARIIQEVGAEGVGALDDLKNGAALVAFGNKLEAVADGAVGTGLKEGAAQGGGDQIGERFDERGGFGQSS